MPFTTINFGIQLTIPTSGTRNWDQTLLNTTWRKISEHRHTGQGAGDGNQIDTGGIVDGAITSAKLAVGVRAKVQQSIKLPTTSPLAIDWQDGEVVPIDLENATEDITLDLSGANPTTGNEYILLVTQGATPRDLNYPVEVKFPGGQDPVLSTGDNEVDKIRLYYDGANYIADWDVDYS